MFKEQNSSACGEKLWVTTGVELDSMIPWEGMALSNPRFSATSQ